MKCIKVEMECQVDVEIDETHLGVPLRYTAVLVARDDILAEVGETGDGDLGNFVDNNAERRLAGLLALGILVDVVDEDCAELSLTLLRDTQELLAVLAEFTSLDGGSKLPCLQKLASLDFPQSQCVVGATGG